MKKIAMLLVLGLMFASCSSEPTETPAPAVDTTAVAPADTTAVVTPTPTASTTAPATVN